MGEHADDLIDWILSDAYWQRAEEHAIGRWDQCRRCCQVGLHWNWFPRVNAKFDDDGYWAMVDSTGNLHKCPPAHPEVNINGFLESL